MKAKVHRVTEDLKRFEQELAPAMEDETKRNLVAYAYSKRGLIYLTNLRDFDQALKDFVKASELFVAEKVMVLFCLLRCFILRLLLAICTEQSGSGIPISGESVL